MPWPKSTKTTRVPTPNVHAADCPTRLILDDVMSRWGALVLVSLLKQNYRFSELAYLIGGVSEKMLSQTLRRLEMDGFVRRKVHDTKPPRVEYSLSPLGCELAVHVQTLVSYVQKHSGRVLKNRASAVQKKEKVVSARRAT